MYNGELQPGELKAIFYELMMTDVVNRWLSDSSWEDVKRHLVENYGINAGKFDEYFNRENNVEENKKNE